MRARFFVQTVIRFLNRRWLPFSVTQDLIAYFRTTPNFDNSWADLRRWLQTRDYQPAEINEAVDVLHSLQDGCMDFIGCLCNEGKEEFQVEGFV